MDNEIDQVTSLVSRLCVDMSSRDYAEFLKYLIDELKIMLDAAS